MKILHRYLFKEILHHFALFVMVFIVIMLVNEIFDTRENFIRNSPRLIDIVLFLIYSLPEQLSLLLPMMGLLATLMAYGLMAKNREILAMIAAGISYRRLAFPALAFGLMLSVGAFWFNESVVPGAYSRARYLEKVRIDGRSESVLTQRRNVFVKGVGDRFYFMQEYLPDRQEMIYPTILEIDESGTGVRERIDADSARLVADASGSHHWEFVGAQRWVFEDGVVADYQQFSELQLPMEDDLDRFLSRSRRPEEMNIRELNEYIAMVSRRGGERVERFATMMHQKIAFPAVCLMMTLLGFVASVDLHARRFARSALSGLVVAIVYYLTDATLVSLGGDGFLPPFIAAWASVIGLLGVVLWMLRRLDNTGF